MSRKFWGAALHLYVPSLLMMMGQGMIIPALPHLGQTYSVSGALAVQVITAQQAGRFLSYIPTGAIVDRWGSKVPMVAGATVATISLLAAAFSPNFMTLMLTQFIWGIGQNMWMFGREIAAAEVVRAEQRGRALSALMGISGAGTAFGPAVGGFLTEPIGIRGLFLVFFGISSVVLLISFSHRSIARAPKSKAGPMLDLSAFRQINSFYRLTYFILFFSTFGVLMRTQVTNTMLPLYTQDQLNYSPAITGILFTVLGIATFAIIIPGGIISDKFGRKWAAAPAALIGGLSFVAMPFATNIVMLAIVLVFTGFSSGMAMGSMTTYTFDIVPRHLRGQLQALRRTFGETGAIVGPLVAGIVASTANPSTAFIVFSPLLLAAGLALVFIAKEGLPQKRPPGAPPIDEGQG